MRFLEFWSLVWCIVVIFRVNAGAFWYFCIIPVIFGVEYRLHVCVFVVCVCEKCILNGLF